MTGALTTRRLKALHRPKRRASVSRDPEVETILIPRLVPGNSFHDLVPAGR